MLSVVKATSKEQRLQTNGKCSLVPLTFEKAELHAASHALADERGHVVVLVDDTHLHSEALSLRRRSEGHLEPTHKRMHSESR